MQPIVQVGDTQQKEQGGRNTVNWRIEEAELKQDHEGPSSDCRMKMTLLTIFEWHDLVTLSMPHPEVTVEEA